MILKGVWLGHGPMGSSQPGITFLISDARPPGLVGAKVVVLQIDQLLKIVNVFSSMNLGGYGGIEYCFCYLRYLLFICYVFFKVPRLEKVRMVVQYSCRISKPQTICLEWNGFHILARRFISSQTNWTAAALFSPQPTGFQRCPEDTMVAAAPPTAKSAAAIWRHIEGCATPSDTVMLTNRRCVQTYL